ncbi:AAA family ATPase [Roseomonas xinghualingensis]|uniref:AAA family ATPase n=1 Tax=Roseomonas xinghualingensis TaxID=2986475 RepID=UPI0021F165E6|nr:ATP-binding protein [Roseomonas sp. SXEYE001]MCV4208209.1 ATP-binding protein [Roseomonas sp. SXEYE001]
MASSKQLLGLIRSHATGDESSFFAIAEHIASDAAKAGRGRMADEIRTLVSNLRTEASERRPSARPTPIFAPRGELASILHASYPETRIDDLILSEALETRLRGVTREHRERELLAERGLEPRRKLLLAGPPGTGKTMTAAALAGELGLPLFTVMLDGVITKFMGETAAKLRLVFDAVETTRGVYFFDEVDALATSRGTENDVGEARRTLNSLLQFLDQDKSASLLIAATNHSALLDAAIFRRFDASLAYERPSSDGIQRILKAHLGRFSMADVDWIAVSSNAAGLSQADLVAAAKDAARVAVLDHNGIIRNEVLGTCIAERAQLHRS